MAPLTYITSEILSNMFRLTEAFTSLWKENCAQKISLEVGANGQHLNK